MWLYLKCLISLTTRSPIFPMGSLFLVPLVRYVCTTHHLCTSIQKFQSPTQIMHSYHPYKRRFWMHYQIIFNANHFTRKTLHIEAGIVRIKRDDKSFDKISKWMEGSVYQLAWIWINVCVRAGVQTAKTKTFNKPTLTTFNWTRLVGGHNGSQLKWPSRIFMENDCSAYTQWQIHDRPLNEALNKTPF